MGLILPERIPDPSIAKDDTEAHDWITIPGKLEEFTPLYWEGPEMTRIADVLERIADALEGGGGDE